MGNGCGLSYFRFVFAGPCTVFLASSSALPSVNSVFFLFFRPSSRRRDDEGGGCWATLLNTQHLLDSAAASGAGGGTPFTWGKPRPRDVTSQVPRWAELDPGQGRKKIVVLSVTSHSSEGEPRLSS